MIIEEKGGEKQMMKWKKKLSEWSRKRKRKCWKGKANNEKEK